MGRLRFVLLHSLLMLSALGQVPFSEDVAGTTGMALCCRPEYWNCYAQCPTKKDRTDPGCLARCESGQCVARSGACAKGNTATGNEPEVPGTNPGESATTAAQPGSTSFKGPSAAVHYDGKLTGPGTIHFEAYNLDTTDQSLAINGVIIGRLGLAIKVLKTSPVFSVMPGKATRFTLEVSQAEFEGWNRQMTQLTIAIGFADDAERDRWTYQNLLTQQDVEKARTGEFQIKGAFAPNGRKKK